MRRVDVVVVGAGLAGLSAARVLVQADLDVAVLEASDAGGGRVRTDMVDGVRLDRGLQLVNPAYPELRATVDLGALDLRAFEPGVVVAGAAGPAVLEHPLRRPRGIPAALSRRSGGFVEKAGFAAYVAALLARPAQHGLRRPDVGWGEALDGWGVSGNLRRRVLEPFLAGVLAEDEQQTSRRFVDLLLRCFVLGTPGLPADGVGALPDQLAERLPPGVVHLGTPVSAVAGDRVDTAAGSWRADAVLVAADPVTAARLCGLPAPTMRALTTFWLRAPASPAGGRALLHLDGDRRGPLVNAAVVSDAAPTYCSEGALVGATLLGEHDDVATLAAAQAQLGLVYGTDAAGWEHLATYAIRDALPAMLPPLDVRRPTDLGDGLHVAGDHRDTASQQGAMVSGRRAATGVLRALGRLPRT